MPCKYQTSAVLALLTSFNRICNNFNKHQFVSPDLLPVKAKLQESFPKIQIQTKHTAKTYHPITSPQRKLSSSLNFSFVSVKSNDTSQLLTLLDQLYYAVDKTHPTNLLLLGKRIQTISQVFCIRNLEILHPELIFHNPTGY